MMITKKLKFRKISTWPAIPVLLHLQIVIISVVLGCFFNVVQNARLPKGMFSLRLEMKDKSAFGGKSCE